MANRKTIFVFAIKLQLSYIIISREARKNSKHPLSESVINSTKKMNIFIHDECLDHLLVHCDLHVIAFQLKHSHSHEIFHGG